MELAGVYPALTTPFAPDGSVSVTDLQFNIQRYNATEFSGYVVLGSTGEAPLLSRAEIDRVLATVKEVAGSEKRLIAGTGAESTMETIERTKRAAELGYHAALVKTPHYYKPAYKPEVFISHYRRVADESPIPVLLYSVPQFTGITLEAPEVAVLAEHPNIIGIKESSGSVQRLGEIIASSPAFQVLGGSGAIMLAALNVGARGAILAIAAALPERCVELYQLVRREQWERARHLQSLLLVANKTIAAESGIAGIKFAMDRCGYRGGIPRLPLLPLADAPKQRILQVLASLELPIAVRA